MTDLKEACGESGQNKMSSKGTEITEDSFGQDGAGHPVRRFTMINKNHMSVQVISYGATVTSIKVPDKRGHIDDVVLGFDDMSGYLSSSNPYFGATVGRVANRVYPTEFVFNKQNISLNKNAGDVQLHGGIRGFDKVIWEATVNNDRVIMTYISASGEEGYPGAVLATVVYQLTADNRLAILMKAAVTKPTMVNLTNHSYFNLAGHASGSVGLLNQYVTVNADKYTPLKNLVCTGEMKDVANTGYELRTPKHLKTAIEELPEEGGFDINYCLNHSTIQPGFNFAARIVDPESGRVMEVHTDQPGMQVYTSNQLGPVKGKCDAVYGKHSAICFETQKFPNAIHIENFPSIVVKPGKDYSHLVTYSFGTLTS